MATNIVLGVSVVTYVVYAHCCYCIAGIIPELRNMTKIRNEEDITEEVKIAETIILNKEEETYRFYNDNIKSVLKRIIKTYRSVKPEMKLATCFSRYAGIISNESLSRAMKKKETVKEGKDKEYSTLRELLRGIVHVVMLFLSDIMPQPMANMMKTMSEIWYMSRDMYTAMRRDEMGGCSMDYMEKRFWWWLGMS